MRVDVPWLPVQRMRANTLDEDIQIVRDWAVPEQYDALDRILATVDPEHIRLMEDECRLARSYYEAKDVHYATSTRLKIEADYNAACAATDAYREERGLA